MSQIHFALLNNNAFLQIFLHLLSKFNHMDNWFFADNSLKY